MRDILQLVRQYGKPTHFCHISTAAEIHYLTEAKEEGLPITVGVCPHHLYLTEDDVATLGPLGMMKPELKTSADRDALWAALESLVSSILSNPTTHRTPWTRNSLANRRMGCRGWRRPCRCCASPSTKVG